jgi:hypothetical protein
MKEKRKVFFTMVYHPLKGWMRCGNAYGTKEAAKEWVPFVRKSWRGLRTKVVQFTLELVDGKPSEKSRKVLDKKFNLDA